jgi:dipeptidyl-peptidase-4
MKKSLVRLIGIILCLTSFASAQDPEETLLTLEKIFKDKEFDAESFGKVQWLNEGNSYTPIDKKKYKSKDIDEFDTETGTKKVILAAGKLIPEGKNNALELYSYQWSGDKRYILIFTNTKKVWRYHTRGDYWIYDMRTEKLWQLGSKFPTSTLMFAEFSPDDDQVAYVCQNNIYVENLTDQRIRQLTMDGSGTIINGTFDWVYEEEFHLRKGFHWSPDSEHIAFWRLDAEGVGIFYMINNTDSIYPELIPIQYPKVGTTNSSCKIGVVNTNTSEIKYLSLTGDPRQYYIAWMEWVPNSKNILFQRLNRLQNTIWLTEWNTENDEVEVLLTEKDDAWLDVVTDIKWLNNNSQFIWISERDGWRHLYLLNRNGGNITCVSPGNFDVIKLKHVDSKTGDFYFIASPENPTQRYLYRGNIYKKSEPELLNPESQLGTHDYEFSPDGKFAIHTYSAFNVPPRTELVRLPSHEVVRVMIDNSDLDEKIQTLDLGEMQFFRVNITDNVALDGWLIFPPKFDPSKKYPVLFYIYGEPWNQTVLDKWFRSRHIWHVMLSQKGYIIMSIDNRGTPAPRGREWRKMAYGKVGILASQDQESALKTLLRERVYLDEKRIAIWGWSGGGSMSLNMIFRYPDLYHTAMSVAPVSNQLLYDTIYQERYMGLPGDNPGGYRDGSPITHAKNLRGNLLLVHGTGDDNVHYQGSENLINELILHNKPFTMMAYPNRSHSICEGENTTFHLYSLLTRYLTENMPPDPLKD